MRIAFSATLIARRILRRNFGHATLPPPGSTGTLQVTGLPGDRAMWLTSGNPAVGIFRLSIRNT